MGDQLRQLNAEDWQRFGIPDSIKNAIKRKLEQADANDADDEDVSTITSDISNDLGYPLTSGGGGGAAIPIESGSNQGTGGKIKGKGKGEKIKQSPVGHKSDTTS